MSIRDYNPVNIKQRLFRAIYVNKEGRFVSHNLWDYSLGDATRHAKMKLKRLDRPNWKLFKVVMIVS